MRRLERTNPWFIGAPVAALLLTAFGVTLSAIAQGMTNAAQLVIGISRGVPVVAAFHVTRRAAVLLLVESLYRCVCPARR